MSDSVGVGNVLSTSVWWDTFYSQLHADVHPYWDWYVPNELVMEKLRPILKQQAMFMHRISSSQQTQSNRNTNSQSTEESDLSALKLLQIGCGNSEISAELSVSSYIHDDNFFFCSVVSHIYLLSVTFERLRWFVRLLFKCLTSISL